MRIETLETGGFVPAMHAMRNPMNSWHKNDTEYVYDGVVVGPNDQDLSRRLTKAGSEHCKHLRQIHVWVDMTLPRYVWSEMDTYGFSPKVSTSTMHKIDSRHLTKDDFETDIAQATIDDLNVEIDVMQGMSKIDLDGRNKQRRIIKGKLPESYLQMRTVDFTYATLLNIINQRYNHKLIEWHEICNWIIGVDNFEELTGIEYKRRELS